VRGGAAVTVEVAAAPVVAASVVAALLELPEAVGSGLGSRGAGVMGEVMGEVGSVVGRAVDWVAAKG